MNFLIFKEEQEAPVSYVFTVSFQVFGNTHVKLTYYKILPSLNQLIQLTTSSVLEYSPLCNVMFMTFSGSLKYSMSQTPKPCGGSVHAL